MRISDEEREAVKVGTTGGMVLESAYWRAPSHRDDPDLRVKYLHDKVRFCGLNGQKAGLHSAITETTAFIQELRGKPAGFRASRIDIVNCVADLLQFSVAGQDLLRFVPPQNLTPRRQATAARLHAFEATFQDMMQPAANYLTGARGRDQIAEADLGVVIRFSDLAGETVDDSNMYLTRYKTMESALRLGRNAGLRVVAIPDYLFSVLDDRPANVLSFHTAGQFPGFTHFKRGDLQTFMILDQGGYSGWSTLSGANIADLNLPSVEDAEAICRRYWTEIVLANVSAYEQEDLQSDADPLPESYVFVPLQVSADRTQLVARFEMTEMLDIVIQRFAGTKTSVVVKPHPKETDLNQLAMLVSLAEAGTIILRFDSIHRLIAGSEAVITVNSGVGSETLLHRKPIYCFGAADYDPVAHRIETAKQFNALTTPIRLAVSEADLVRFSAYYRNTYLVEWSVPGRMDAAMMERVINPILAAR